MKEQQLIYEAQTKAFPCIEIKTSIPSFNQINAQFNYSISSSILQDSTFHKEILERNAILKPKEFYEEKLYFTQQIEKLDENQKKNELKICGLEFFGLLRTGMDSRIEYENSEELKRYREAYLLHILDYVFQDRDRVSVNDKKLFEESQEGKLTLENVFEIAGNKNEEEKEDSQSEELKDHNDNSKEKQTKEIKYLDLCENGFIKPANNEEVVKQLNSIKDQGFTRPKVLILAPFKSVAYEIVENIVKLANGGKWKKISKKKKFRDEFGSEEEAFNDYFRVGIAFNQSIKTNKKSIKLFEQFYKSDIIVASPLGLRTITGQEEDENAHQEQRVDFDFLSSIEFLVLDQAEAFVFQNIEHLEELLKVVNKTPKKLSDINDINRIKELYTHTETRLPKLVRQNIVISKFRNLDLEYCLDQHCNQNVFGSLTINKLYPNMAKQLCQESLASQGSLKITLRRIPNVQSFEHVDDSRFSFFTKQLWEKIYESSQSQGGYTILFVPSYFDFVRLRTFLKNKNAQVAMISEYSEKKDCQRSRHQYDNCEKPVLMITERALVFQKIQLRYARNIVLYALPESLDILSDSLYDLTRIENWKTIAKLRLSQVRTQKDKTQEEKVKETQQIMKEQNSEKSIVGLYSKFDRYQLERVVGSANFKKMLSQEAKDSFSFS